MSFWEEQSNGPVITVNGVTYRSPEQMPSDARKVWDHYARQMERQKIDWREQGRIDLSWRREGSTFTKSISIQRRTESAAESVDDWRRKIEGLSKIDAQSIIDELQPRVAGSSTIEQRPAPIDVSPGRIERPPLRLAMVSLLLYILCFLPLAFYGVGSREPMFLIASDSVLIYASYVALWLPWPWWIARFRSRWKWSANGIAALLWVLLLSTFAAAFSGVPRLLHSVERQPGQVTLIVSAKRTDKGKRILCNPRLQFEGLRLVANDLCVNDVMFDCTNVGDPFRFTGQISPYGISPDRFEPLSERVAQCMALK